MPFSDSSDCPLAGMTGMAEYGEYLFADYPKDVSMSEMSDLSRRYMSCLDNERKLHGHIPQWNIIQSKQGRLIGYFDVLDINCFSCGFSILVKQENPVCVDLHEIVNSEYELRAYITFTDFSLFGRRLRNPEQLHHFVIKIKK